MRRSTNDIVYAPKYRYNFGIDSAVILPDGSYVYPREYMQNTKENIKGLI
jgi:hypothetical protein